MTSCLDWNWSRPEPAPKASRLPAPLFLTIHCSAQPTSAPSWRHALLSTVVIGDRDVPCFMKMADILEHGIRGARLVRIPRAGHMTPMEAPEAVVAAIESALAPTP
jgi:pimeloyl-ACP methyl ester carboxylesterase